MARLVELEIQLNYHPAALEVLDDPSRFKLVVAGRRWSKSRLIAGYLLLGALQGQNTAWTFPTYRMGTPQWYMVKQMVRPLPGIRKLETERRIEFPGGGILQFKSADRPDGLRGDGLDRLGLDEAAFLAESAWTNALRPSLADKQGSAILASSPKGQGNWLYRQWCRVPDLPGWKRWQWPTASNPYIRPEEIEEARRSLTDRVFRQEFQAEFLPEGTGLFEGILAACEATPQDGRAVDPETGDDLDHVYVAGLDLARVQDWTVLIVVDVTLDPPQMVYLERFQRLSWRQQIARIRQAADRFRLEFLLADATGLGDPVTERLADELGDLTTVDGFRFTPASKAALLDDLATAISKQEILLVPDQDLVAELQCIEPRTSRAGRTTYEAPEGMHDDRVMSLALAYRAASKSRIRLDIL